MNMLFIMVTAAKRAGGGGGRGCSSLTTLRCVRSIGLVSPAGKKDSPSLRAG